MQTLTIEINDKAAVKALQNLEAKHFIRIVDSVDVDSPALPGKPLSVSRFKEWVYEAEQSPTVSLKEAKAKWAQKRKQLQKITK